MEICNNRTNDRTGEVHPENNDKMDLSVFDYVPGLHTGFNKLDDVFFGLRGGDLIVVSGWVKMGKTMFVTSLLSHVCCKMKIPALLFSIQHNASGVGYRLMANLMSIKLDHLFSGEMELEEWESLDINFSDIAEAPLYINDDADPNIDEIMDTTLRMKIEKGIRLVVIDSLSLVRNNHDRTNYRYEEITDTVRELKCLARKADIPIVVTCGVNRRLTDLTYNNSKLDDAPSLYHLRDSGCIEEMADVVLFIHRPEEFHIYQDKNGNNMRGMAQIIVAKNNRGKRDVSQLEFIPEYARFTNPKTIDFILQDNE